MSESPGSSTAPTEPAAEPASPLHRMAMAAVWVVATAFLAALLVVGVEGSGRLGVVRAVQVVYVAGLLAYLARTGPSPRELPELRAQLFPSRSFGPWIAVVGVAAVFVLIAFSEGGMDTLPLLLMLASLWLLVAWWRALRLRLLLQGVAVGIVAFLVGLPMARNGVIPEVAYVVFTGFAVPMYIAGALLVQRTRLGGARLAEGSYAGAFKGVVWGSLLFLPLGLANLADGGWGFDTAWVTSWWMPAVVPWYSGIVEEIWWRLLVAGLVYFLLRPAFKTQPAVAVVAAVLVSGLAFGLFHGRTMGHLLTTGFLYGVPLATLFATRDWEHAVGAHFMVNLPTWVAAYLQS